MCARTHVLRFFSIRYRKVLFVLSFCNCCDKCNLKMEDNEEVKQVIGNHEENTENAKDESGERLNKTEAKDSNGGIFLLICIIGVSLGILLEIVNIQNRKSCKDETSKYWVYSAYSDVENRNGLLKHVHLVLERIGYEKSTNQTPWSLLWSHDYPFRVLYPNLHKLKPHQKVNHFPGTGFITNKVDLATTDYKYIPKAYKLPQNKEEFLKYSSENKNALFVEKHNQHRKVYLKNVSEIDLSNGESFVQEYVQKPFLVDGHKFDIGVYVVLTSVDPLRVYWYKGDVLFRYCPVKYYPFDPSVLDKYVVGDDYLPTWKVPSLTHSYQELGFSMKDAFDIYATSKGKDPERMWEEVQKAIAGVFQLKEKHVIEALKHYPSADNFFELMRVDLVVDEDLNVYLLEANMSPNLSSAHYPPNQLLYEQVLYNLFAVTGVANYTRQYDATDVREQTAAKNMVSTDKNLAVWGKECETYCRDNCEGSLLICRLCKPCISRKLRHSLLRAHREHLHKGDFRRLYPPPMQPGAQVDYKHLETLSEANKLQHLWYQGKCNIDSTCCT